MIRGVMYVGKPPTTMALRVGEDIDDESLIDFTKDCCDGELQRLAYLRVVGEKEPVLFLAKNGEFKEIKWGDFLIKEAGILHVTDGEWFLKEWRTVHS